MEKQVVTYFPVGFEDPLKCLHANITRSVAIGVPGDNVLKVFGNVDGPLHFCNDCGAFKAVEDVEWITPSRNEKFEDSNLDINSLREKPKS